MRSLARDLDDDPAEAWDDVIGDARFAPVGSDEMTTRILQDRQKWNHERAFRFLENMVSAGRATWRWANREDGRRVKAYKLVNCDETKPNKTRRVSAADSDHATPHGRAARTRARRQRRAGSG